MQVFKINRDGINVLKKQMLNRIIPLMSVVMIGAVIVSISNSKEKIAGSGITTFLIMIVFIALAFGAGIYSAIRKQKALLESYTLTITNNLITREQLNTPTISIYFNDINSIIKTKKGAFLIKGRNSGDLIFIPPQIDNVSTLEALLSQIRPFSEKSSTSLLEKYQGLVLLLTIGLMLCVYGVNNKIVVVVAGTGLVALMTWSFIKTITSKNINSKTKRSMWWILVVLASVIAVMAMKLSAMS
ncbi:hypothetical protein LZZ85_08520 [Terrimonas sp. NA20]|uniref:YcxB-like protein domain-containing protein n=1 Tax=Terrimonas ginsenosidimutans TaxID=2908004 RepID=A0ABS9KPU3_9BACT|nr:hypothetical protein [Terrimonas ginsenosidimutans]MCG2614324.1 hypothetical protein [Terrimonas ginsenosidimutans]